MPEIKAIETRYAGCRFRSRLEARWARFFDFIGVRWKYEKEGFDLGKSGAYLPDFWLPDLGIWYEIKGVLHWDESEKSPELELMKVFRDNGVACCLSEGLPGEHRVWWFGWDLNESSGGSSEDFGRWTFAINNKPIIRLAYLSNACKEIYTNELYENELLWVHLPERSGGFFKMLEACQIARSARFEHGESG
jgi:hypothetical protein